MVDGPPYARNNHWMIPLSIDADRYGRDREALMAHLTLAGVQTRPVWHLNHLQKPYAQEESFRIETALELAERTLNLPCSTNLSDEDLEFVCDRLRDG